MQELFYDRIYSRCAWLLWFCFCFCFSCKKFANTLLGLSANETKLLHSIEIPFVNLAWQMHACPSILLSHAYSSLLFCCFQSSFLKRIELHVQQMGPACLHSALQHGVVNVPFCHGTLQFIFPKQIVDTCNLSSQCHLVWPQCPAGKILYLLTSSRRHHISSWLIVHEHQNLKETQLWVALPPSSHHLHAYLVYSKASGSKEFLKWLFGQN